MASASQSRVPGESDREELDIEFSWKGMQGGGKQPVDPIYRGKWLRCQPTIGRFSDGVYIAELAVDEKPKAQQRRIYLS